MGTFLQTPSLLFLLCPRKAHDPQEDRRKEKAAENQSGGVDGVMVMIPPNVKTRTQWLVTTIVKAEYLPIMDDSLLMRKGGDFYTMVGRRKRLALFIVSGMYASVFEL